MMAEKKYSTLKQIAKNIKDILGTNESTTKNFFLLYAYNGTGKTRLSGEFKELTKKKMVKIKKKKALYIIMLLLKTCSYGIMIWMKILIDAYVSISNQLFLEV